MVDSLMPRIWVTIIFEGCSRNEPFRTNLVTKGELMKILLIFNSEYGRNIENHVCSPPDHRTFRGESSYQFDEEKYKCGSFKN